MKNKKTAIVLYAALIVSILLNGCSKEPQKEIKQENTLQAMSKYVSTYIKSDIEYLSVGNITLEDNTIYYSQFGWNKDLNDREDSFYVWNYTMGEEPKSIYTENAGKEKIYAFFPDKNHNRYFCSYQKKEDGNDWLLTILDENNNLLDELNITDVIGDQSENNRPAFGAVSGENQIYLANSTGHVWILNSEGQGIAGIQMSDKIVNAYNSEEAYIHMLMKGEQGEYIAQIDGNGKIIKESSAVQQQGSEQICTVIGMSEEGALVKNSEGLSILPMEAGKKKDLFSWKDEYVSIDGHTAEYATIKEDGTVSLLTFSELQNATKIWNIKLVDESILTRKKTLTLGVTEGLSDWVKDKVVLFNQLNHEYRVEIKIYEDMDHDDYFRPADQLYKELIEKKGPDLIMLTYFPKEVLRDKQVLEPLDQYLEQSVIVNKDDILPSVIRNGIVGEQLVFLMPRFFISTMVGHASEIGEKEGWTPWEVMQLSEQYPKKELFVHTSAFEDYFFLINNSMDSFINIDGNAAHLEDRFHQILMWAKERGRQAAVKDTIENISRLAVGKEYLLYSISVNGLKEYREARGALGGDMTGIGLPSEDGRLVTRMTSPDQFGINAASPQKEGAWEFIEFLFSEECQENSEFLFPSTLHAVNEYMEEGSPEEKEVLYRWMDAAILHGDEQSLESEARAILTEEGMAYFEDRADIEKIIETIQSRVNLLYQENN